MGNVNMTEKYTLKINIYTKPLGIMRESSSENSDKIKQKSKSDSE